MDFYARFISHVHIPTLIRVGILLFLIAPLIFYAGRFLNRVFERRVSAQVGMIVRKIVHYGGGAITLVILFHELGFNLTPLLGAAGVVGVALGFASQTSVSNIISGIFLIAERPFEVNDIIQVGDITGSVLSIDLLSIKLRTLDNRFVRIPNESIIKSQVINVTRFPIRRVDVPVSVAYKENLKRVRAVLLDVAFKNPICLQEPEPLIILNGFGSSSIDFTLAVWVPRSQFLELKNRIQEEIKERFDQEGIEMPFPHVSLYAGSESSPISVQLVDGRVKEKTLE
jgi:small-conductance mechanosensitive channel